MEDKNHCKLPQFSVEGLALQYAFEIIPECPASNALGYTPEERAKAEVLTGPVFDKCNFYYSAYFGSLSGNAFKSALFIARNKKTGALVYAVNTEDYSLDTGNNYLGNRRMVTRTLPVIHKDKIYLTGGWMTNIGPQLFCINKTTGALVYAIAYYIPNEAKALLEVNQITKKNDYSAFRGTNSRISTLNPLVLEEDDGAVSIYCGNTSYQNVYNVGLIKGTLHYTGYPYYTDQGFLTKITESSCGTKPEVTWRVPYCAPELKVGDKIVKGSPSHDPFPPEKTSLIIGTLSYNTIVTPGPVDGKHYFAQVVEIKPGTVITETLFAPFWSALPSGIYLDDDKGNVYSLALILPLLTVGKHTIYTLIDSVVGIVDTPAMGTTSTNPLWYTKLVSDGETIANKYDANSLNYWGNGTWGGAPVYDECRNVIYSTSGQSHSMPLEEILQGPSYVEMKKPLVQAAANYVLVQTDANLVILNQVKDQYQDDLRTMCLTPYRSPRGQESYSDAVAGLSPSTPDLHFGVRSMPLDVYSFLGNADPKNFFFMANDADGDASSGAYFHKNRLTFTTKSGCAPILDIKHLDKSKKFDHKSLCAVGVRPGKWVYTGPNGILGGSNYQSASNRYNVFTVTANNQKYLERLEDFVTRDGLYIPGGISAALVYNMKNEEVTWNFPLSAIGSGSATYSDCGAFLTADIGGNLYGLDEENGNVVWQYNSGGNESALMKGGVASPSIDYSTKQVFWISSYSIPGNTSTASKYGYVLRSTNKLLPPQPSVLPYKYSDSHGSVEIRWKDENHVECKTTLNEAGSAIGQYAVEYCSDHIVFTHVSGGSNILVTLLSCVALNKKSLRVRLVLPRIGTIQEVYMNA